MRLTAALRLKPGAIILFGDDQYIARCSSAWKGKVLQVAPSGAVKVRVIDAKPWGGRYVGGTDVWWVPHTHIL